MPTYDSFLCTTYRDFLEQHGGNPIQVSNRVWLLPSGASITNIGDGPALKEPPRDEKACLEARRRYHMAKLERAAKDFRTLTQHMKGSDYALPLRWNEAEYGPLPKKDNVLAVKRIREVAAHHAAMVEYLDGRLSELPEVKTARERDRLLGNGNSDRAAVEAVQYAAIMRSLEL